MADSDDSSSQRSSNSRWKDSKTAKGIRAAGSSLSESGKDLMDRAASERVSPVQYRKGGKVHKSRKKDRTKTRV
jgi:hypothetical protein